MTPPRHVGFAFSRQAIAGGVSALLAPVLWSAPSQAAARFHRDIEPILSDYCYDCHGDGEAKGNVAFDEFSSDQELLSKRELWAKVLRNVRSGLMPADHETRPSPEEIRQLADWIKYDALGIDPSNPDPGRVTLRRLNRVEYHNTVHDLMGVDFDTTGIFPADDTGNGFDNMADVLSVSPLLFEKYIKAAEVIVGHAIPLAPAGGNSANYRRFFPQGPAPSQADARLQYAREIMRRFATKAFRRPPEDEKVEQLAQIARSIYEVPGKTFEQGIAQAMTVVLASPRFLFRIEPQPAGSKAQPYSAVDEYALASRLSYFLWSTMPDDELLALAARGELRQNLSAEIRRMLASPRSEELVRNFTGQWLQARDVEFVSINARLVLGSMPFPQKNSNDLFSRELRRSMRRETEMVFDRIMRENRDIREFLESDYTYVNGELARLYGITGVTGPAMRLITLPPGSPRGGVLTEGTVLTVTSNPDRTSPVKRGQFILENILGAPAPPPPPNIPNLEDSKGAFKDHQPTLREMLLVHRHNPACAACHARMDPLGFALENFTAMGTWRDTDHRHPIDPSGRMITGESFKDIRDLKHILATDHKLDFYRCLAEKLLTYALGRGLEDYDVYTVDQIVDRLEKNDGRFSALLFGVIESAPFQEQRNRIMTPEPTTVASLP